MRHFFQTARRSALSFALPLTLLFSIGLAADDPGLALGKKAPDFVLKNQAGKEVRLADLRRKSHVALVYYRSADWCPYCKHQLVELNEKLEDLHAAGVEIVGISYDAVSVLAEFAKEAKITYPLLSDKGSKTIDAYEIRNAKAREGLPIPMTFLIDQSGTVRAKLPGTTQTRHSVGELLKAVAKLPPVRRKIAWNAPPEEWQWVIAEKIPGMIHGTIDSPSMKRKVGFNVYLPPGYKVESEKRFPVIYYLHGAGGSERSALAFGDVVRAAIKDGDIREAIWVFPNGGHFSGYRDWKGKNVKSSTFIIKELVPHIDSNYPTIADRRARAICGFSMGGGGAVRFALQYPDLFCAAGSLAGAFAESAEANGGANVLRYSKDNAAAIRKGVGLYLVCGEQDRLLDRHRPLVALLKEHSIRHEFVTHPGIGHNLGVLKELSGRQLVKAIDRELYRSE